MHAYLSYIHVCKNTKSKNSFRHLKWETMYERCCMNFDQYFLSKGGGIAQLVSCPPLKLGTPVRILVGA